MSSEWHTLPSYHGHPDDLISGLIARGGHKSMGKTTIKMATVTTCPLASNFIYQLNTLRPRQNGRRFADDTFKRIFLNENVRISNKISLKFVPKGPINNIPALVQIMAWRRSGDKPLSEPMMVSLLTHICVTRPQWVKPYSSLRQPTSNIHNTTPHGCKAYRTGPGVAHLT